MELVDALLRAGADPNAQDRRGRTPLHATIERRSDRREIRELVRLLIEHGADVDLPDADGTSPRAQLEQRRIGRLPPPHASEP